MTVTELTLALAAILAAASGSSAPTSSTTLSAEGADAENSVITSGSSGDWRKD